MQSYVTLSLVTTTATGRCLNPPWVPTPIPNQAAATKASKVMHRFSSFRDFVAFFSEIACTAQETNMFTPASPEKDTLKPSLKTGVMD